MLGEALIHQPQGHLALDGLLCEVMVSTSFKFLKLGFPLKVARAILLPLPTHLGPPCSPAGPALPQPQPPSPPPGSVSAPAAASAPAMSRSGGGHSRERCKVATVLCPFGLENSRTGHLDQLCGDTDSPHCPPVAILLSFPSVLGLPEVSFSVPWAI